MSGRRLVLYADPGTQTRELASLLETLDVRVETLPAPGRAVPPRLRDEGLDIVVVLLKSLGDPEGRFLKSLRRACASVSLVVVVSSPDRRTGVGLIRGGTADHVLDADDMAGVYGAVRAEIVGRDLRERNLIYLRDLGRLKAEKSGYLRKTREIEEIYDSTVENLMTALDLRDVETFGHSQTVAKYCEVLAELLGIAAPGRLAHIRMGALLHDIGKIAIPDSILKKPGDLSPDEWDKIKLHPTLGFGLIREIKLVAEVGNIILFHHERYDGAGYPKGLKGSKIPLEARIFALADALDAITAHRPYRRARDFGAARTEIVRHGGTQFDPAVVEAFASLAAERWERIRFETTSHIPPLEEYSQLVRRIKR